MERCRLNCGALSDSSNASSSVCFPGDSLRSSSAGTADLEALRRLSDSLEALLFSPDLRHLSDARISKIPVHRCVLSARSPFFRDLFARSATAAELELEDLFGPSGGGVLEIGREALLAVLGYVYTGRAAPPPREACACADDECPHVACRPTVEFMVQVLFAAFTFQIFELVSLYQRRLLDILDKVWVDDVPSILLAANLCSNACSRLLARCVNIVARSEIEVFTLDKVLPAELVRQIVDSRWSIWSAAERPELSGFPAKSVQRIYRALDSDDLELLRMLLKEDHNTSIDDAMALHYAVAHCDAKMTAEILDLGIADVNLRNARGYTPLHVAALRKEPQVLISLLTKGARPSDVTEDGRKALQISKRLTRYSDYCKSMEQGEDSPKDRLCVEILEQAESSDPLMGLASVFLAKAGDDLRSKLLYLENRVALAKMMFPREAGVAMDIAQVDGTLEFTLGSGAAAAVTAAAGSKRPSVDLNETPFTIKEEHLARMRALSRTVELGKRFFPRCSNVLDKIMDDDLCELACLGRDSTQEKRTRYMELQDSLSKAFSEDREENQRSGVSPSSTAARTRPSRK